MKNEKFEEKKRGIELLFKFFLVIYIIEIIGYLLFKLLYVFHIAQVDIFNMTAFVVLIVCAAFMYLAIRLSQSRSFWAGIIGVLVGVIQILSGAIISIVLGVLLVFDSIFYLVNYQKKS